MVYMFEVADCTFIIFYMVLDDVGNGRSLPYITEGDFVTLLDSP